MRVAVVTDPNTINANYRAVPVTQLARLGHDVRLDFEGDMVRVDLLSQFDVVHIYRYHDKRLRSIAKRLRDAGVALVWDNDDDFASSPDCVPNAMRSQQSVRAMIEMLRLAHLVTTTSPVLAGIYREWGAAETMVVENYVPDLFLRTRERSPGRIVIGWTAAREHDQDYELLGLRATLLRILDRHDHVDVRSVGIDLGLPPDRYHRDVLLQFVDLPHAIVAFDIGIAPIADIPFNRARSNCKVKEYAAAGVPWLASPIGPYAGLGEKQGGRLVADDRWLQELERLIVGDKERRKLARRARRWAQTQVASKNLRTWERAMVRATELARSR